MENTIAKRKQQQVAVDPKRQNLNALIKQMEPGIKRALPSAIAPERFTRIVLSALSTTPKLYDTTPESFMGAMMTAAQLGLEPNTPLGQAYLLPYGGKCQFQLGYRGMIELAYRSGRVKSIQARTVCENDTFEYELGLEPKLKHVPAKNNRGKSAFYYAVFHTVDGGYGFDVMSREDVEQHAKKYSQSYNRGPWATNFDQMAQKTVLKRLLKYAPLGTEFLRAVAADESIRSVGPDYSATDTILDAPNEFDFEADAVPVDPATGEVTAELL